MKELTNINFRRYKWRLPALIALLVVVVAGSFWLNTAPFRSGFEITDELEATSFLPVFFLLRRQMRKSLFRLIPYMWVILNPAFLSGFVRGRRIAGCVLKLLKLRSFPVPYLSLCWLNHGRNIRSIPILSGITKR